MLIADAWRHGYGHDPTHHRGPEGVDERLVPGKQQDQLVAWPCTQFLQPVENTERALVQLRGADAAGFAFAVVIVGTTSNGMADRLHQPCQRRGGIQIAAAHVRAILAQEGALSVPVHARTISPRERTQTRRHTAQHHLPAGDGIGPAHEPDAATAVPACGASPAGPHQRLVEELPDRRGLGAGAPRVGARALAIVPAGLLASASALRGTLPAVDAGAG